MLRACVQIVPGLNMLSSIVHYYCVWANIIILSAKDSEVKRKATPRLNRSPLSTLTFSASQSLLAMRLLGEAIMIVTRAICAAGDED